MHAKLCMIPSGVVGACDNLNAYNIIYCESLYQLIIIWKTKKFYIFVSFYISCMLASEGRYLMYILTHIPSIACGQIMQQQHFYIRNILFTT
jgi:hypothetical protein